MDFSERLKNYRISHKMTQEGLAEKFGVSRQTISRWENGQSIPDWETVNRLQQDPDDYGDLFMNCWMGLGNHDMTISVRTPIWQIIWIVGATVIIFAMVVLLALTRFYLRTNPNHFVRNHPLTITAANYEFVDSKLHLTVVSPELSSNDQYFIRFVRSDGKVIESELEIDKSVGYAFTELNSSYSYIVLLVGCKHENDLLILQEHLVLHD